MMKGIRLNLVIPTAICLTLVLICYYDYKTSMQSNKETQMDKLKKIFSTSKSHKELGGRYDNILDFCGELCDLTKTITPGPIVGTVTAKVNCKAIFASDEIDKPSEHPPMKWEQIPPEIQAEFNHYGNVKIVESFREDQFLGGGRTEATVFTEEDVQSYIDGFLSGAPKDTYAAGSALINEVAEIVEVTGKTVLVIGTQTPWVEAVLLSKKPAHIITLEYGSFRSEYPNLEFVTPAEFRRRYTAGELPLFDLIFTYSSVEHSGLGRYGDALNPWGDILTIARAWCVSSPTAKLVVGVPVGGKDTIEFNSHRIYGPVLYPFLATNWKFRFSTSGGVVPAADVADYNYQPVYVFEKINNP